MIFIATLFVVSEGIDATGVTTWAGQRLIARAGTAPDPAADRRRCCWSAGLTALITLNGAVAALLPLVVLLAMRIGPLAVAAADAAGVRRHAGSLLMLTGSPST